VEDQPGVPGEGKMVREGNNVYPSFMPGAQHYVLARVGGETYINHYKYQNIYE
jgi:hypothetical protein